MPVTWADTPILGSPRNPSFAPPNPHQVAKMNEMHQKIIQLEEKVKNLTAKNLKLETELLQLKDDQMDNLEQLRQSSDKIWDLEMKLVDNETYFEESMKAMEEAKGVKFIKFDGEKMREIEEENRRKKCEIEELEMKLKMEMERKLGPKEVENLKKDLSKIYQNEEILKKNAKIDKLEFELAHYKQKFENSKIEVFTENLTLKSDLEKAQNAVRKLADEVNISNSKLTTVTFENEVKMTKEAIENDKEKRILRGYNEDLEKTVQLLKQW